MHPIDIFLQSEIADDSFEAVELKFLISRIKAYVLSTNYERFFEIRGNWSSEKFTFSVLEKFLDSKFLLRIQV